MYHVYQIKIENQIRYIGITKDPQARQKQHNYGIKKRLNKLLYENIHHYHQGCEISLEVIKTFNTKTEAARYEAFLILQDHFTNKELWQSPPRIFKYH